MFLESELWPARSEISPASTSIYSELLAVVSQSLTQTSHLFPGEPQDTLQACY